MNRIRSKSIKKNGDMANGVAQQKCNNIKCYVLTFRYYLDFDLDK